MAKTFLEHSQQYFSRIFNKRALKHVAIGTFTLFASLNVIVCGHMIIRPNFYLKEYREAIQRGERVEFPRMSLERLTTHLRKHGDNEGFGVLIYPGVRLGHAYLENYAEKLQEKQNNMLQ